MQNLKKYLPLGVAALVVLVAVAIAIFGGSNTGNKPQNTTASSENCGNYRNDKIVTVGQFKLIAEATKNQAEMDKGLAGRPCIPEDRAMLFSFPKPGYFAFWMKGMKFPIDIVWVTSNHRVVGAVKNVSPSTYPQTFRNNQPAQYALEMKANRSKELDIKYGTVINF